MSKKKSSRILSAVLAAAMIVAMVVGLVPTGRVEASQDKVSNIGGFQAKLIADPDTSGVTQIFNGSPAEDGKIWTDKSVTTGSLYGTTAGENNFNVALSAMAQTYSTVTTSMETTEHKVAYDVAFVLDFSDSMNDKIGDRNSQVKAAAMVDAANAAIQTLMENENNRIGIIGYSGTGVTDANAETLFSLDHYTTEKEGTYLQYSNNSISAANSGRTYYVTNSKGVKITNSKSVDSGTPTQRGIYEGFQMLNQASKTEDIVRVPIMILLTDGQAGVATNSYETLSGGKVYNGSANGISSTREDDEVAAYTMLTANYAKTTIDETYRKYYDYDGILEAEESVSKFYTIGLGIDENEWTHFMLEPSTNEADRDSKVSEIKTILRSSEYKNNYNYVNKYFGGSISADELKQIFDEIIADMEVEPGITTTIKNPVSESGGGAEGSTVTFTDYLGYKMELKGDIQYLRYDGINYEFKNDGSGIYTFTGKTQNGESNPGPSIPVGDQVYSLSDVVFKAEFDADKIVNGQTGYWKVTWEFPSALLPMYSRKDSVNDYSTARPIRMLYEVGLEEDVDFRNDGLGIKSDGTLAGTDAVSDYAFYSNLYDFENNTSEATVSFQPALDNPYYYKTGYTTEQVAGSKQYLKLNMVSEKNQYVTVTGKADVTLSNISVKTGNSGWSAESVTFYYNNQQYTADLSGDYSTYTGSTSILVTAIAEDGSTIEADVPVDVTVVNEGSGWRPDYKVSEIQINGEKATLKNSSATATVEVSEKRVETEKGEEIISVYLELSKDGTGWFVTDLNGKRIDVEETADGQFEVELGKTTYYSSIYYKYADGESRYVEKQLDKGQITEAYVGNFNVRQPKENEKITKDNFSDFFSYVSSSGKITKATGVMFSNGDTWGSVSDKTNLPKEGTFVVMIDGITNADESHTINLDFTMEEQKTNDGTKYSALDCAYFEKNGEKKGVDLYMSSTPEVKDGDYIYDVSFTVLAENPDDTKDEANKTSTDEKYYKTSLKDQVLNAQFGNNGRIAVKMDGTTYEKAVTVKKQWIGDDGQIIQNPKDLSVTAGLYREYSYTDENGNTVTNEKNAGAFDTVELNQENNFTYTWEAGTLPRYLLDEGGNYVLDKDSSKVPITYVVSEDQTADGWSFIGVNTEKGEKEDTFTLSNAPLFELSPSVTKVWTKDGKTMDAPEGYAVKAELKANGETVKTAAKYDTEPVKVTLTQESEDADAILSVEYRGKKFFTDQVIQANDIAEDGVKQYSSNIVEMVLGTPGQGDYANKVQVSVTIANTYGGKLGISDARVKYFVDDAQMAELIPAKAERTETDDSKYAEFTMTYVYEKEASVILNKDNNWSYTWNNEEWHLPMFVEKDGQFEKVEYSVEETLLVTDADGSVSEYTPDAATNLITVKKADGTQEVYKATSEHNDEYKFTITNDLSDKIITADKVWIDNNNAYETRPSQITFSLTADDQPVANSEKIFDSTTDVFNGKASAKWTNLPVYNTETGKKIDYDVVESKNDFTVENGAYDTTVSKDEKDANHFVVTNKLSTTANVTSVNVEKVWVDNDNAYNTRPEKLYMVLYRQIDGGEAEFAPVEPIVMSPKDLSAALTGAWSNLPMYNEDGFKYNYSVKEYEILGTDVSDRKEGVTGYTSSTDVDGTTYKFTNTLEAGKISKTVEKVWNDKADENSRPESIQVKLSGTVDGTPVDLTGHTTTVILNQDGEWKYTWNDLPKYQDGKKIDYTVEELTELPNYTSSVQDDGNGDTFTITNTLTGTTSVTVTKEWNTPEGFEIPEVTFNVIGEHDGVVGTLTVTKDNLTAVLDNLPMYNAAGEKITYTVQENALKIPEDADYTIDSIIGENIGTDGNFVYKAENTYRSLVQNITGTKTWAGVTGDNIPQDITVELYRQAGDGESELVTDENENALQPTWNKDAGTTWTYTYENMPVYEDDADKDTAYTYSIKETKVGDTEVSDDKAGDYTVTYDGMDITNTLGGTIKGEDLKGTKTWVDVSEENIPDSIVVELLQNGTAIEKITVNGEEQKESNVWNYDFKGESYLKYDENGTPYVYTVQEVSVTAGKATENVVYEDATNGTVGDYVVTLNGMNITNTLKGGDDKDHTVEYTVIKNWDVPDGTTLPANITVQLLKDGKAEGDAVQLTADYAVEENANQWSYTFTGLRKYADDGITQYVYSVEETKVGNVEVKDNKAGAYTVDVKDNVITNSIEDAGETVTDITVTKQWKKVEKENLPNAVSVQLYQNGNPYGNAVTLNAENEWKYTFNNLPKYADGVTAYTYTVQEVSVTAGEVTENVVYEDATKGTVGDYTVEINGFDITNTLNGKDDKVTTSYPVTKNWVNVDDSNRPANITVQLMKDEVDEGDAVELTADNAVEGSADQWSYTFTELRKYADNGITPYKYSAKETKIADTAVVDSKAGDFFVTYEKQDAEATIISNRLATPGTDNEKTSYTVNKKWLNANGDPMTENLPASITVQLQQNGNSYGEAYTFTSDDVKADWTHTFTDLPKYQADGLTEYDYSVEETKVGETDVVEGKAGDYTVTIKDNVITNTLATDAKIEVTGTKTWAGISNDNLPESITVELVQNGTPMGADYQKKVTADDNWSYTFKDLPKYDEHNVPYTYTVQEIAVDGNGFAQNDFTITVDGMNITNTLNAGLVTSVSGTKTWEGTEEGKLPASITVELVQNGTPMGADYQIVVTANEEWKYTFENVPRFDENGKAYSYSIKEVSVSDGTNSEEVVYTDAANGTVGDYTVTLDGMNITNTLKGGDDKVTTSYPVTKNWVNVDDSNRPANITVQLMKDGADEGDAVELTSDHAVEGSADQWSYTFIELRKYADNGITPYAYSAKETKIADTAVVDGKAGDFFVTYEKQDAEATIISNRLATPGTDNEKTSYMVNKKWLNANGDPMTENLPANITVQLQQNGTAYGEAYTFTEEDVDAGWTHTFTGLLKYQADGLTEYDYSVEETKVGETDVVEGKAGDYTVTIKDNVITNTLATDAKIEATGIKNWAGISNDNLPESITVELVQDGTPMGADYQKKVTAEDNWSYTFKDLPKYNEDNGLYKYTVQEIAVDGNGFVQGDFTTTVDGMNITNTLNTGLVTSVSGTKNWEGTEEGKRPTSITVELVQNGTPMGAAYQKVVTANEEWKYTFENVPRFDENGKVYAYSIKEVSVSDGTYSEEVVYTDAANGTVGDYTVTLDGMNITNTLKGGDDKVTTSYPVTKNWNVAEGTTLPESITVQLMKDGADEGDAVKLTADHAVEGSADQWSYTFIELRKYADNGITPYAYSAKETKISDTAVVDGKAGDFFVTYEKRDTEATIINNRLAGDGEKETTEYKVEKQWLDADGNNLIKNLPDSITVNLKRDGEVYQSYTFTSDDVKADWTHTFTGLPKYQADGLTESIYSVEETAIHAGDQEYAVENGKAGAYVVTVEDHVIKNQLSGEPSVIETSVSGTKTWVNAQGEPLKNHPDSVTIQLYQDGQPMEGKTVTITEKDNWTYTFSGLPKYQPNGVIQYVYTVKETMVGQTPVDDSEFEATVNGTDIQNQLKDIRTSYTGEKIWKDAGNTGARPESVEIELLANGNPLEPAVKQTVTADASGRWGFIFDNLAKYDADGNEIVYSVRENNVDDDYNVTYEGNMVINILKPGSRDVTFTKHWEDDTDAEGYRPDSIQITLKGETYTLTAKDHQTDDNTWVMTVEGLPKYDASGNLINYGQPVESAIAKYTPGSFTGDIDNGFEITNTLTLGEEDLTSYAVTKIWKDNNNEYQTRPENITVELYQDEKLYDSVELNEENSWSYTFTNLPVKRGDVEENHVYTVKEISVENYVSEATHGEGNVTTFTNTLTGKVNIDVTKEWTNVTEEYLPESVSVSLHQNGVEIAKADLTAENGWTYDFGEFDKYDESGTLYDYTVVETAIGGEAVEDTEYLQPEYRVSEETEGRLQFTVVNTLNPDLKVAVSGTKTWVDNDDQFKMRPESIIVNLLRDGEKVDYVEVKASEDGTWTYEFKELPKYEEGTGRLYEYTISEEPVENYITTIDGFDITNVLDESKIPEEPKEPEQPTKPTEPAKPSKPQKPSKPHAVQTGDDTSSATIVVLVVIALGAVAAVIVVFVKRKRNNK